MSEKTVTSDAFAKQAREGGYVGIPYHELDCQAFVEKVLRDCGIRRNWRGSNHMWRAAVYDAVPLKDADLVPGMWLFTVKNDGGEKERGYNDDKGNATHVGIYLGTSDPAYIHSTTGGVQYGNNMARWTHAAKAYDIDYSDAPKEYNDIMDALRRAFELSNELTRIINILGGYVTK